MHDKCGLAGVALNKPGDDSLAALNLYYALYALQHRGQESAGIATFSDTVNFYKAMGLVSEVFSRDRLAMLKGNIGIGHVRYSTTGGSTFENSQPMLVNYKNGTLAIAHNGNLVNSAELKRELEAEGRMFLSSSDTEVIAHILVKELIKTSDYLEAIRNLMRRLNGSYSLTILLDGMVFGVRDPCGFKPLGIGKIDNGYVIASESVAVDTLKGKFMRDINPGEVVIIRGDGSPPEFHQLYRTKNSAHCFFEFVYFARADSIIDGKLVYDVRLKIGETLAKEAGVDADIVAPVPDSGITFALGYSRHSGVPYTEAMMKNRYVGRTFIMPVQDMRETAVLLKLNMIRSNIKDKRLVLIDDSIVRGTTSRRIINMLKENGAKEVHYRVGSPPIISPCYLGIDMATREELIAAHKTVDAVEYLVGADSLHYITLEGLLKSIGIPTDDLCLGCITGVYPVEIPGERSRAMQLKLTQF